MIDRIIDLRHTKAVVACACALMLATVPVFMRLGSELMPPLDEGALFYMPSTMPGIELQKMSGTRYFPSRLARIP